MWERRRRAREAAAISEQELEDLARAVAASLSIGGQARRGPVQRGAAAGYPRAALFHPFHKTPQASQCHACQPNFEILELALIGSI